MSKHPFLFAQPAATFGRVGIICSTGGPEEAGEGGIATVPELAGPGTSGSNYRVILYNDEWHAYDEVVHQVMKACECQLEEAVRVTEEAHFNGRSVCYRGEREKCHKAVRVLREIRLQCEVDCD